MVILLTNAEIRRSLGLTARMNKYCWRVDVGVNKKPAVPELQHRNKVYKERHNRSGK
jgi:hypothetical protein